MVEFRVIENSLNLRCSRGVRRFFFLMIFWIRVCFVMGMYFFLLKIMYDRLIILIFDYWEYNIIFNKDMLVRLDGLI